MKTAANGNKQKYCFRRNKCGVATEVTQEMNDGAR